jgi:hypothetical protein
VANQAVPVTFACLEFPLAFTAKGFPLAKLSALIPLELRLSTESGLLELVSGLSSCASERAKYEKEKRRKC